MGRNQRKSQPPAWRFELHSNIDALVPEGSPRGRAGKKKGSQNRGDFKDRRTPSSEVLDPDTLAQLVPHLPRDLVVDVCASTSDLQEALAALGLHEEDTSAVAVGEGVSVVEPDCAASSSASVALQLRRSGDAGSLWLPRLPAELAAEVCALLGASDPASLGRLAQSCTGCRGVVGSWLAQDVGCVALGLGMHHCSGVGGPTAWGCAERRGGAAARFRLSVPPSWGGERGVRLLRGVASLRLLAIDCAAPAGRPTARGGFGAAALRALWASPRLLHGLSALRLLGSDDADPLDLARLAQRCPQLTALDLSGCAQLTADVLPALAALPLRALALASNPQLPAAAVQAALRACATLRHADVSYCDGAVPAGRLGGAPHHAIYGEALLAPLPPDEPPPPPPAAGSAAGGGGVGGGGGGGGAGAAARSAGWGALPVRELYVRGWVRLTALALGGGCAALAALDVSRCAALGSLQLQLPALRTLSAANCAKLELVILECPALRSLTLTQCRALYVLQAERSAVLQSANLFGCRSLGAAALGALLDVAGASLRALNLNGCASTEEVAHEQIVQSCPSLALLDDVGRVRKF